MTSIQKKSGLWMIPLTTLLHLAAMIGFITLFVDLAVEIWRKEGFAWDAPVALAIHHTSRPWLDGTMRAISASGGSLAILLVIGCVVWFGWRGQLAQAATLLISFTGAIALNTLLKVLFARPHPNLFPPLIAESGYSFPSGHTIAAVAFYGLLAVWLWRQQYHGWAIVAGVWVVAIGISRVYLGAHYPSDVLASWAIGGLWLLAIVALYNWYEQRTQYQISLTHDQPKENHPFLS